MTEREVALLAYQHKETPWIPATLSCQDTCLPRAVKASSRNYGYSTDWLGVKYYHPEDQVSSMPLEDDVVIKDMENWEDYLKFPDIDAASDWEKCAALDTARWDRENKISSVIIVNGLFEAFHMARGMENALCDLVEYPDEVKACLSALADHQIRVIRNVAKYYKPDKIQFHDDYGQAQRMFMSLSTWRELIKPSLKRIVEAAHECGLIYEHHSCGYIAPLLDDLIEIGVDAWNPVQFVNNPYELQEKYSDKLTLIGGFDDLITNNSFKTDEEVKAALEAGLTNMKRKGWIAQPAFIADVGYRNKMWVELLDAYNAPLMEPYGVKPPVRNYEAICDTRFRRYPDAEEKAESFEGVMPVNL